MLASIIIDRQLQGRALLQILQTSFQLSRKSALEALRLRQVTISGSACTDAGRRVKLGQHVQLGTKAKDDARLPELGRQIVLRFADEHVLVVEKPAGLTTVRHADEVESRARKFLQPTLVDLMPGVLARAGKQAKGRIRAVHRLDKETSGLVVLARTAQAEAHLGKQFRAHTIGRRYLALVRGHAKDARIESTLLADRGDGRRGSVSSPPLPSGGEGPGVRGQHAVTHVRVIEPLGEITLVECELETGRTHQVRIHLGEAGTPLCGERVYDRPLHGKPIADGSGAKRPMLHAAYLAFDHPETGKRMEWEAKMPEDMTHIIARLRSV